MHIRVHIRNYANFIIYIWACMYICVYIYSNGNVLPSVLVPVYGLYIFCYQTLLYGGNKEIYLSISSKSYEDCFDHLIQVAMPRLKLPELCIVKLD